MAFNKPSYCWGFAPGGANDDTNMTVTPCSYQYVNSTYTVDTLETTDIITGAAGFTSSTSAVLPVWTRYAPSTFTISAQNSVQTTETTTSDALLITWIKPNG